MKKTAILFSVLILSFSAFSQKKEAPGKIAKPAVTQVAKDTLSPVLKTTLTVELTPKDWEIILDVINQSNSPHPQVTAVQTALLQQLQPQAQKMSEQAKQPAKKD